jgi:hypothetical protein
MKLVLQGIGIGEVEFELDRYKSNLLDCSPALQAIADDLRVMERRQFDTQGAYRGPGWEKLTEKYVEWKRSHNYDTRIGHRTKHLRASLTTKRDKNHVEIVTRDELVFSTLIPYAAPFSKIRPILPVTPQDAVRWAKIVQNHIVSDRR